MADRVVLHVGTMKTGTTYLQSVLSSGILETGGAFYPGERYVRQTRAVQGMLGSKARQDPRIWHELAAEVAERPGVAVYSQEFLSFTRRESTVHQLVGAFGGIPVEVVLTVRDQHSALPAQWQSFTRNRGTDAWATYVDRLIRARAGGAGRAKAVRSFRRAQDVPSMVSTWLSHEGVSSVTVVILPPPGSAPQELWHRFCEAARIVTHEPPRAESKANESLGYASCDLFRRVNAHLKPLNKAQYKQARASMLEVLLPLRPEESRPVLDRAGSHLARQLNRDVVTAVSSGDVHLVGKPEELTLGDVDAPAAIPPPEEAQMRRAIDAVWGACLPGPAPTSSGVTELSEEIGQWFVRNRGGGR